MLEKLKIMLCFEDSTQDEGLASHNVEGETQSYASANDFAPFMDEIRAYLEMQKDAKRGKLRFL